LLFAQSVALLHAFWHAAHDVGIAEQTAYAPEQPGQEAPESAAFCSFDAVLGQLLSAGPPTHDALAVFAAERSPLTHRSRAFTAADVPTPRSRGPPVSL
jgi:hypothetical protein